MSTANTSLYMVLDDEKFTEIMPRTRTTMANPSLLMLQKYDIMLLKHGIQLLMLQEYITLLMNMDYRFLPK